MNRINWFLLIVLLTSIGINCYAQEKVDVENYTIDVPNVPGQVKQYHAKLILTNGQKLKGIITSIGDKSIQLEKVVYKNSGSTDATPPKSMSFNEINYHDIQTIKIRGTPGETLAGFLVGTAVGVIVGGLGGLVVSCPDCDADDRLGLIVLFAGLGGAIIGPIGAIDGPFIVHIKIAGQYNNFEKFKTEMDSKEIRRQKKIDKVIPFK